MNYRPDHKAPGAIRRKAITISAESMVKIGPLIPDQPLPLLVEPSIEGVDLVAWARTNRDLIELRLSVCGAILFRNFGLRTAAEFEQFMRAMSGELLDYTYASTPRRQVSGNVYTSTEYPAEETIPLHNEMSYSRTWPLKIWFFCVQPADEGGETPIADSRKVFSLIDPDLRERFARKRVMYVRNYGEGLDLSWQSVFQTSDRSKVEQYCREAGIEYEWKEGNRLKTHQVCQAVSSHPATGEMVWFNQAHLFHISSLDPDVRRQLTSEFSEEDLPRNAYYGDGSPIEDDALDEIRACYEKESVAFRWEKGDILMLDNMLTSHGRRPFRGARQVLVGMADPVSPSAP